MSCCVILRCAASKSLFFTKKKYFLEKSAQMLSIINPNHFGISQNPKMAENGPKIALARASSVKSSAILERLRMRSTETLTSDDFKTTEKRPKTTENSQSKMKKLENMKNSTQESSVSSTVITVISRKESEEEKVNLPVPKPRSRSISRNASANSRSVFSKKLKSF